MTNREKLLDAISRLDDDKLAALLEYPNPADEIALMRCLYREVIALYCNEYCEYMEDFINGKVCHAEGSCYDCIKRWLADN